MRRSIALIALLPLVASPSRAVEPAGEIRYALEVSGDAAVFTLSLPPAVYADSRLPGLADVGIHNGAGEPVPFTFDPAPVEAKGQESARELKWFEVPQPATPAAGPEIGVALRPDGTLVATGTPTASGQPRRDLIDLGTAAGRVRALRFDLAPVAYQGRVAIDVSADLERWSSVASATLTRLGDGDAVVERSEVTFPVVAGRYLRLTWLDAAPSIRHLFAVERAAVPELKRDWLIALPAHAAGEGAYEVEVAGRRPIDRLVLHPPQVNTVASVRILSRPDGAVPWRTAAHGSVVSTGDGGAAGRPIILPAIEDRFWRVEVDSRAGGFGKGEVTVDFGWLPATVTFLARGGGPFTLALGGQRSAGALSRAAVLPPGTTAIAEARVGARIEALGTEAPNSGLALRQVWLWCGLIVAVTFLAFMALRMLREPPAA